MGRLFGTDGIRGIANKDLTCELATQLGRAAAKVLTNSYLKLKQWPIMLLPMVVRQTWRC